MEKAKNAEENSDDDAESHVNNSTALKEATTVLSNVRMYVY